MLRAIILAVLLMLPLTGCQASSSPPAAKSPIASSVGPERPQTEAACTAAGGRWEKGGLAGVTQCFLNYSDAGKACQTATDCQGLCLTRNDGPAQCQKVYPLFGCVRYLDAEGNRVGVCID